MATKTKKQTPAAPAPAPAATETKQEAAPATPRPVAASKFTGKVIHRLTATNPRRAGTHGNRAWDAAFNGGAREFVTYEEYRANPLSGLNHLAWDISHKFVEILDAMPAAPAPAAKKGSKKAK